MCYAGAIRPSEKGNMIRFPKKQEKKARAKTFVKEFPGFHKGFSINHKDVLYYPDDRKIDSSSINTAYFSATILSIKGYKVAS